MTSLFLTTFVGLISLLGIAVNGYIIFVIALAKQANTVNGILLMQASALELALSMSVLTCSIPNMLLENPHFVSVGYCSVCGFLVGLLRPIAVWTVCGLNCDRYYAISAPLHYASLINSKKVLTTMSVTWISFLVLAVPLAVSGVPYTYNSATFFCMPSTYRGSTFSISYSIVHSAISFVVPLVLVIVCNIKVFTIARHHKHRIASAIFEVTLSAQVTITHQKNPFSPSGLANRFRERKASLSVIQLVGSFLIVYGPYYGSVLWQSTNALLVLRGSGTRAADSPTDLHPYLASAASVLLFCSSSVNGLLYGVKSKVLKKSFQNYWRKKMTKNEVNQEIQARTPSTCGSRRPSLTPAMSLFSKSAYRRPSDISLETQKSNLLATSYPRFHGNNTFAYRPGSSPGLEMVASRSESFNELKRTHSFRGSNSMKLGERRDGSNVWNHRIPQTKGRSPTAITGNGAVLLLHRLKKNEGVDSGALNKIGRKSPKILITRAFSEENESQSQRPTVPKTSSSVTTLLIDSTWKSMSRESIAFSTASKNKLFLTDFTDDSASDESQEDVRKNTKCNESLVDTILNSEANTYPRSWPFPSKRRNIKFRMGSMMLSDHDFTSSSRTQEEQEDQCEGKMLSNGREVSRL